MFVAQAVLEVLEGSLGTQMQAPTVVAREIRMCYPAAFLVISIYEISVGSKPRPKKRRCQQLVLNLQMLAGISKIKHVAVYVVWHAAVFEKSWPS